MSTEQQRGSSGLPAKKSILQEILGVVLTKDFWISMGKSLATEASKKALSAFFKALSHVFGNFAEKISPTENVMQNTQPSVASRVWDRTPSYGGQEYRPPSSYPVPIPPSEPTNSTFPGFTR